MVNVLLSQKLAELSLILAQISFLLGAHNPGPVEIATSAETKPKIEYTDIFDGYPLLKRACSCESWGDPNKEPRQFNEEGNLIKGYPKPTDIGACQINSEVHLAATLRLGFNIYLYEGNVGFAKWLYDREGMGPWHPSEDCWREKEIVKK